MNSFYGGQKGLSFELVKTYNSKEAMIADFGSLTCSVIFGQYVSISSSDENAGEIYRRTQNLANGQNGAVLVGTIKGVNGQDAKLNIVAFDDIAKEVLYLPVETLINVNPANAGYYELSGVEYIKTTDTVPVPGKTYYEQFSNEYILNENGTDLENTPLISGELQKDTVKFRTKTTKVDDIYETSVGVQFPYNVIKFNTGIDYENNFSITPVEQKPFYQEYLLKIPQILNGDSLKQMKLITNSVVDKATYPIIYSSDNPNQILERDTVKSAICYKLQEHNLITNYIAIETPTGNPKKQGWYIAGTLPDNYILTTDETVIENRTYYQKTSTDSTIEKWYKLCNFIPPNLTYSSSDSSFHFSDDTTTETVVPVKVIDNVSLNNTGTIEVTYTTKDNNGNYEKDILTPALKWIDKIELENSETGIQEYYKITYNDGSEDVIPTYTNSITNVVYNEENGKLTVIYSRSKILTKYRQVFSASFDDGQTPVELGLFELNPTVPQYQLLIQDKLDNNEFETQEEYITAIDELIEQCEQTQDFLYQVTENTTFLTYNNGEIKKAYFQDTGEYKYFSNEQTVGVIKAIKSITYDEENSQLIVIYNTGETEIVGTSLRGVSGIRYDLATNQIKIYYTDGFEESLSLALKFTGVDLNKYNQFVFKLNDGTNLVTSQSLVYPADIDFNETTQKLELRMSSQYNFIEVQEPNISQIKNYYEYNEIYDNYILTTDTSIDEEKTYYLKFPAETHTKEISPALNYIQDVQIDPETYNLLVLFSDPELKGNLTFNNIEGWQNLGCIKDNSGLWVTGLIEEATVFNPLYNTIEHTINTLNSRYPQGYHNNIHECIAVGAANESKKIYAYDDTRHTWYLLGNFNGNTAIAANTVENYEAGTAYNVEALPEGGLWFVTEGRMDDYDEDIEYFGTYWEYF